MRKRKQVLILLSLLTGTFSYAQFTTGSRMLGLSVGTTAFNAGNTEYTATGATGYDSKTRNFNITLNPSMGWFKTESLVIGISGQFSIGSGSTSDISRDTTFRKNEFNSFTIGAGGFVRKYFKSTGSRFLPFANLSLNGGVSGNKNDGFSYSSDFVGAYKDTYDNKTTGGVFINSALALGATKMLTNNVGLDFTLGYSFGYHKNNFEGSSKRDYTTASGDYTTTSEYTGTSINHGVTFGVGVQVFIPKK